VRNWFGAYVEAHWWSDHKWCRFSIGVGGDGAESGPHVTLGVYRLFLHFKLWVKGGIPLLPQRTYIELAAHDGCLWVSILASERNGWSSRKGRTLRKHLRLLLAEGVRWSWSPAMTLFGKEKYWEEELSVHDACVPMPESVYPVKVTLFLAHWKRPRLPWGRTMRRARVLVSPNEYGRPPSGDDPGSGSIPTPGKGENSWDCDQDGTCSMTCEATTVEEAAASMFQSVMRDRRRYGSGFSWRPVKVEHAPTSPVGPEQTAGKG
jgi:hypothetical protein